MSHLIGLEAVKRYAELVHLDPVEISDKLTEKQMDKALQKCGDTLALFVYREGCCAEDFDQLCSYLGNAIRDLNRLHNAIDDALENGRVK